MSNSCTAEAAARAALDVSPGEEESNTIWLGILIGLLASYAINTGQNLEDFHTPKPGDPPDRKHSKSLKRLGTIMFIIAAISNFVAFSLAPTSLLAPLEGAQFVSNLIFNVYVKDKSLICDGKFTRLFWRVLIGTLFVIGGIVLPVVASGSTVAKFDGSAIWCFWGRGEWWLAFSLAAAVAGACFVLERFVRPNPPPKNSRVDQLIYAVVSVFIGAFAVVNAKAISELVELILVNGDWEVLKPSQPFWMTLVFVAIGFAGWIYRLTQAPKRFNRLGIVPLLQGLYILTSSIGGGVFFDEFAAFDTTSVLLFVAGMAMLVVGLFLIVPPETTAETPCEVGVGAGGIPVFRGIPVLVVFHGSSTVLYKDTVEPSTTPTLAEYAPLPSSSRLPAVFVHSP